MPKRSTDTDIWIKQRWFKKLISDYKLAFFYIKDSCDHAGIWRMDCSELMDATGLEKFDIKAFVQSMNVDYDIMTGEPIFKERIRLIKDKYLWLTTFIQFQYSGNENRVSPNIPAVRTALQKLNGYHLLGEALDKGFITLTEPLQKGYIILTEPLSDLAEGLRDPSETVKYKNKNISDVLEHSLQQEDLIEDIEEKTNVKNFSGDSNQPENPKNEIKEKKIDPPQKKETTTPELVEHTINLSPEKKLVVVYYDDKTKFNSAQLRLWLNSPEVSLIISQNGLSKQPPEFISFVLSEFCSSAMIGQDTAFKRMSMWFKNHWSSRSDTLLKMFNKKQLTIEKFEKELEAIKDVDEETKKQFRDYYTRIQPAGNFYFEQRNNFIVAEELKEWVKTTKSKHGKRNTGAVATQSAGRAMVFDKP